MMHPEIGFSELIVILVVAVVVIGPKDLPKVMRTAGVWMHKVRVMMAHMQGIVNATVREAELAELADAKKAVEDVKSTVDQVAP
jgi:sec-independent protein translocase protein TatB